MSTSDIVIAHEPPQEQASVSLYAWVIVAIATVCLALGFGANIVISVFMKPFEDEFGWLRADTSMAYTMNAIGAGAGGILWGGLSDVVGPKRIGVFGAIALSLGLIAMRWQSELWSLYLVSFLIGAFGFASLFTPMVALAGRGFSTRQCGSAPLTSRFSCRSSCCCARRRTLQTQPRMRAPPTRTCGAYRTGL